MRERLSRKELEMTQMSQEMSQRQQNVVIYQVSDYF